MKKISCIYFMFLKGELVYIGQTVNLHDRMQGHGHEFQHDCLRWIECPKEKLKGYEKRLVHILKPVYNSHFNTNNPKRDSFHSHHFNTPKWMYNYERMLLASTLLRILKNLTPDDIAKYELEYNVNRLQFEYEYRKQGYRGTYLA